MAAAEWLRYRCRGWQGQPLGLLPPSVALLAVSVSSARNSSETALKAAICASRTGVRSFGINVTASPAPGWDDWKIPCSSAASIIRRLASRSVNLVMVHPQGIGEVVVRQRHGHRPRLTNGYRKASISRLSNRHVCRVSASVSSLNRLHHPGLLRAADLIGQLADINYLRKTSALFAEFQETGAIESLGYQTSDDLRAAYPAFFWQAVRPYIGDALRTRRTL